MSEEPFDEKFDDLHVEPVEVLDADGAMEDMPEEPKKKNKTLWIILIVVAAVLLLCCCASVILVVVGFQRGWFDNYLLVPVHQVLALL